MDKKVSWALLVLRVVLGIIFIAHGLQKLAGMFGGPGIAGAAKMFENFGFTYPFFWAWVVSIVETAGGAFLALGIIPRISAGLIGITMIVAIVKVHRPNGFFMMQNGFEYQLLILAACIAIIITGAGKFSVCNKC